MDDATLDMIAGEDAAAKLKRQRLESEVEGLEEATKVFRFWMAGLNLMVRFDGQLL